MERSLWPGSLESPVGTREAPMATGFPAALVEANLDCFSVPLSPRTLSWLPLGTSESSRCLEGEPQASWPHLHTLLIAAGSGGLWRALDLQNVSMLSAWAVTAVLGELSKGKGCEGRGQGCLEPSSGQGALGAEGGVRLCLGSVAPWERLSKVPLQESQSPGASGG